MKFLRRVLRFIAVAALSSFLTFLVMNRTLLSSQVWLDAASQAGVYQKGATALNTTPQDQSSAATSRVTAAEVQVQVERYVSATDHYIRTGEVPPSLEGFSQLATGQATTPATGQASTALAWLRWLLAQQALLGVVAGVAVALALVVARSGRRLLALAGILISTAFSVGIWFVLLRYTPGLLTDNLAVDASLKPFMPIFKQWLVALFAVVTAQLLVVIVALAVAALVSAILGPLMRLAAGRKLADGEESDGARGSRADD